MPTSGRIAGPRFEDRSSGGHSKSGNGKGRTKCASRVVDEVIDAHGGLATWSRTEALAIRFASGGLAFAARGQSRALAVTEATVCTREQRVRLVGLQPRPWSFEAATAAQLAASVMRLRHGRRRWHWSPEDVGAFAATAMWTYAHLPFLLATPDVTVELLPPSRRAPRLLAVRFPARTVTHSAEQVLHIDDAGIIRRHDYTAMAFGRWARAAQRLEDHCWFDGILVPTRRTVTPRLPFGAAAPAPILVWIDIHSVARHPRSPPPPTLPVERSSFS